MLTLVGVNVKPGFGKMTNCIALSSVALLTFYVGWKRVSTGVVRSLGVPLPVMVKPLP